MGYNNAHQMGMQPGLRFSELLVLKFPPSPKAGNKKETELKKWNLKKWVKFSPLPADVPRHEL